MRYTKKIIKGINFDFENKNVLVMGLGLNGGGLGVTKFLYNQKANVTVTDLKDENHLKESLEKLKKFKDIKYVLGQHREEDFINNEIIIKGAGIKWGNKYVRLALEHGNYVDSAAGIFFELSKNKKIGITGSKGKSTTTSLVYKILKDVNQNVKLAGNISKSFFEEFERDNFLSTYVLELSSWQLYDISLHKKSPDIAIITTLLPDHLNYYKTMENYIKDKKYIYKYQKENDFLILNIDNDYINSYVLSDNIKSKLIFVTNLNHPEDELINRLKQLKNKFKNKIEFIIGFKNKEFYIFKFENSFQNVRQNIKNLKTQFTTSKKLGYFKFLKLFEIKNTSLLGIHNFYNISLAIAATILEGVPLDIIKTGIEQFKGVKYRNEYIGSLNGVKFYNDTTATVPDAVAATVNSFKKKVILIAGGVDKELNLDNMVNAIINNVKYLILFNGNGSEKLLKILKDKGFNNLYYFYDDIFLAVKKAYNISKKGDIILLSPGFASFNMFRNEFERGDLFNKSFEKLKNQK